ncbi:phosphopantothenate--cysteine ligase family flavoprotein [uncultured Fibrobacter sp.]|uniref:bifunctional phosphopantothenoylcysteine decarboxylase/phosphopantothenate synthase n=1 Tax=uncultured Fibrobacter sp. TaxID=261512 RepID=UPI0025FC2648|nr:bifunctional phosphopantothenoylcysteine decarboxylase/phosphopantothenate synthase [uncultured Fibrobacter sp.]MBR3670385.1 bifunctional phosphopantothenoylcysteine decarboxylase/phosphopantothenate synthase [Fibrobacter sp.]
MNLAGKKILLGVSGGIAAYKSCELLRLLQKKGATVRVCMTDAATEFVAPLTFASLSKCPVYLKNGAVEARPFQHIDFPRWADLYLVVPATANVIGKFACGIADDPVSLCFMSCTCPRVVAPAMNVAMYNSPAVKRNLEILRGFEETTVLESPAGELACGEVGQGRLMEPAEIVEFLEGESLPLASAAGASSATPSSGGHPRNAPEPPAFPVAQDMDPTQDPTLPGHGKKVLLTAGRTEEAIDPVRYISNRSSGKTAVALASVFYANGFEVEVVAGPMEAAFPGGVAVSRVQSAQKMHDAVMSRLESVDAVVHCAAVADYRPAHAADSKIKDSRSQLTIELVPNPNILRDCTAARASRTADAAGDARRQVIVGFALETDNFKQHAAEKLEKSGADALLLNAPVASDSGFGHDCVRYALVRPHAGIPEMHMGSKVDLAQEIVHFVLNELG